MHNELKVVVTFDDTVGMTTHGLLEVGDRVIVDTCWQPGKQSWWDAKGLSKPTRHERAVEMIAELMRQKEKVCDKERQNNG